MVKFRLSRSFRLIQRSDCRVPDEVDIGGAVVEISTYRGDRICQVRIARDEPSTRRYAIRFVVKLLRPQLEEITKSQTQSNQIKTFDAQTGINWRRLMTRTI